MRKTASTAGATPATFKCGSAPRTAFARAFKPYIPSTFASPADAFTASNTTELFYVSPAAFARSISRLNPTGSAITGSTISPTPIPRTATRPLPTRR